MTNVPASSTTGAELWQEQSDFYRSVGQAISLWASMETNLVRIAAVLLDSSEEKAGVVLYSIISIRTRLDIINGLFQMETDFERQREAWASEREELESLNKTRVRLAHHTVWHDAHPLKALLPARLASRTKSQKYKRLTKSEIDAFSQNVLEADKRLDALWEAMTNRR